MIPGEALGRAGNEAAGQPRLPSTSGTWQSRLPRLTSPPSADGRSCLAAWQAVINIMDLKPGETMAPAAPAWSARLPRRSLTGAARSRSSPAGASPRVAEDFIDTSSDDLPGAVLELTDGRGADMVLDTIGGALFEPAVKSLRFGGRLTGLHSHERAEFDPSEIYSHDRHVTGFASVFIDGADCATHLRPTRSALRPRPAHSPGHSDVAAGEQRRGIPEGERRGGRIKQVLLPQAAGRSEADDDGDPGELPGEPV